MAFDQVRGNDRYEGINYERMRNYRLNRAKEQMKKDGLGCLITWDAWDVRYLTGVYVTHPCKWLEFQCSILPANGDPYINGGPVFSKSIMPVEAPWIKPEQLLHGGVNVNKMCHTKEQVMPFVKMVAKIMADHGITNQPLGLDGCTQELLLQEAFKDVGIEVVDAKQTMFQARKIKNIDEIECIKYACAIADAGFADIADAIRPGVKECELVGIGINRFYKEGCDETQEFVVASGPRTNPLHIDFSERMIQYGDLVVIDVNGNSFNGYKSCYYRTFCCGKATQEQKDIYEECRAMLYSSIGPVKAGNTTWDLVKKWPDSPKYWGYEEWGEVFGYAVGHGLGISLHEYPMINYPESKANPVKLEEGMVIALETWTGKRGGTQGVRLEEMVVVTKEGYDLLTHWPVNEITECYV